MAATLKLTHKAIGAFGVSGSFARSRGTRDAGW